MQKKLTNRFAIWVFSLLLVSGMFASCGPSQYRYYKKMVKKRTTQYGYRSNYQKKLKRNTLPVNRNFIIKNKRTQQPVWR